MDKRELAYWTIVVLSFLLIAALTFIIVPTLPVAAQNTPTFIPSNPASPFAGQWYMQNISIPLWLIIATIAGFAIGVIIILLFSGSDTPKV